MTRIAAWLALLLPVLSAILPATPAQAAERITLGLDWVAEAEYAGFYQAAATGLYAKRGLEVIIQQGGPQVNHTQLLLAGRLDFNIASNSFTAMNFVKQNIPFRAVAATFQKDPAVLLAHPGQGNDSFAALKGKPIMIGADTRVGWWNYVRAKYGYSDSQIRPYTFNLQPFLADKKAIQQGYIGSEPFAIRQAAGFEPVVMLVADTGFSGYASLIATSDKNIRERPERVQKFLDASIEGWYSYLYGDPAPANALIRKENPEMSEALLAYGRDILKSKGIVDSGDALKDGIGAMTAARWNEFLRTMAKEGLYPADLDASRAYTTQFVNKRVGMELKH